MDEVDADIIQLSFEMRELIEHPLKLAPIVALLPVPDEFPKIVKIGAGVPPRSFNLVGPPSIF
jgi:hypothetical protein